MREAEREEEKKEEKKEKKRRYINQRDHPSLSNYSRSQTQCLYLIADILHVRPLAIFQTHRPQSMFTSIEH